MPVIGHHNFLKRWFLLLCAFSIGLFIAYNLGFSSGLVRLFSVYRLISLRDTEYSLPGWSGNEATREGCVENRSVALGMGITSNGLGGFSLSNSDLTKRFELFTGLLPSFCRTASPQYFYYAYLAYDLDDPKFTDSDFLSTFQKEFDDVIDRLCKPQNIQLLLRPVQCKHSKKPAWAQNDAMMEAYLDGCEYFYRINDDTDMITNGWAEMFIETLTGYSPPNIGVVGPAHRGGLEGILTYDFVHKTHVDIFGFYYPRLFVDWSADNWITNVYMPSRSTKLSNIKLQHTMTSGTRYAVHPVTNEVRVRQRLKDIVTLNRYVQAIESRLSLSATDINKSAKVISMSLHEDNLESIWGAVRNAQLSPIIFPDWTLRFYVPHPFTEISAKPPIRILRLLHRLRAEVHYVSWKTNNRTVPRELLSLYVLYDSQVEYFLIRNTTGRLVPRDGEAVKDWMGGVGNCKDSIAHCLRDHRTHGVEPLTQGLWGGRGAEIKQLVVSEIKNLLPVEFLIGTEVEEKAVDITNRTVENSTASSVRLKLNDSSETQLKFNGTLTAVIPFSNLSIKNGSNATIVDSRQATNSSGYNDSAVYANATSQSVLNRIWAQVQHKICCHDSVSCNKWTGSRKYPSNRNDSQPYVGQPYSADEEPMWDLGLGRQNSTCI